MKKIIIVLIAMTTVSAFAKDDLVCGVYLMDLKTNTSLAHKVMIQETNGITAGTFDGADFYIESTKQRLFRKPLVTSEIVFWDMLDTGTNTGTFQFYRLSKPNKHGILTKTEELGGKIEVKAYEEKFDIIDQNYAVKSYCNIKP